MDLGLAGASAVVTGGSKGMGLAIAETLAAEGARVAVMARGQEALDAADGGDDDDAQAPMPPPAPAVDPTLVLADGGAVLGPGGHARQHHAVE